MILAQEQAELDSLFEDFKSFVQMSAKSKLRDTTRPETIERVDEWIDALFSVTGPIPLVLLENKIDLETAISKKNIKKLVRKYKVDLVRTSAKEDDTNVEEAFTKMTKEMLKRARI